MLSKLVGFFKQKINSNIIFPDKPESKPKELLTQQGSQKDFIYDSKNNFLFKSQKENINISK